VQLTHSGGFNAFESVDGNTLFYSKWNAPGIFALSLRDMGSAKTAEEKTVVPDLLPRIWGYWAVTAEGIYYLRPAKKTGATDLYPSIAFHSFATQRSVDIMELDKGPIPAGPGLSVSPDKKYVLYKQVDNSGADIMIVEGFR